VSECSYISTVHCRRCHSSPARRGLIKKPLTVYNVVYNQPAHLPCFVVRAGSVASSSTQCLSQRTRLLQQEAFKIVACRQNRFYYLLCSSLLDVSSIMFSALTRSVEHGMYDEDLVEGVEASKLALACSRPTACTRRPTFVVVAKLSLRHREMPIKVKSCSGPFKIFHKQ
jgi:hypothetical protein